MNPKKTEKQAKLKLSLNEQANTQSHRGDKIAKRGNPIQGARLRYRQQFFQEPAGFILVLHRSERLYLL